MRSAPKKHEPVYLNLYFQVHQPRRFNRIGFFDIGTDSPLFDDRLNEEITRRVSGTCYQPANLMLLALIRRHPDIRVTFSISGVALEQLEKYSPEVIGSFRELASTGCVEFLAETYYHSLASLSEEKEFVRQVRQHSEAMVRTIGVTPRVFRNTELVYSDAIGRMVADMGYRGIYAEGMPGKASEDHPHQLYLHPGENDLRIFLRDFSLSDDVSFRFSDRSWQHWPLTPGKYLAWLEAAARPGRLINIGMDYETFGEHHLTQSGIFDFLKKTLTGIARSKVLKMVTPSEAIEHIGAKKAFSADVAFSWADREKDLSAWLGNDLQKDAFRSMSLLGQKIVRQADTNVISCWRYFQTSDHFYYMSTKVGDDGKIHQYFSPYPSPYEAFINYMNALSCLELALKKSKKRSGGRSPVQAPAVRERIPVELSSICV